MSTNTRMTLAQYSAATDERLSAIESGIERLLAAQLGAQEPARNGRTRKAASTRTAKKATSTRARTTGTRKAASTKAPAKKAATKAAPKAKRSEQTLEVLGRKGWNRCLTALAKQAGTKAAGKGKGKSVYAFVVAGPQWAQVEGLRTEGMTPAEALAHLVG